MLHYFSPQLGCLSQYSPKPIAVSANQSFPRLESPPKISIVTPSYNQGRFLSRTIASVLDQKYPALEYIVQDGGSTDDSLAILKRFDRHLSFWESHPDGGQARAINLGLQKATGDILAYLNADDLLLPGSLVRIAGFFQENPQVDVIYGHRILIDSNGNDIGRWVLPPHSTLAFLWQDFIPQETLFWRRRIWEKVGGLNESLRFAMDWDLILRFFQAGARFARIPCFLGAFRIHASQKTSSKMETIGCKEIARIRAAFHGRKISSQELQRRIFPYLFHHVWYKWLYKWGLAGN